MTERNMDGIEPRGRGSWRVTVAGGRDPITGQYVRARETVHGTMTDARNRRDEMRVDARRGTLARPGAETLAAYLARWIEHRQSIGKVRPKTADVYRGYVRRVVAPRIGSMRIADVRPVHLQRVLDEALAGGLAPRSVVQVHRILHAALRQAVRWQVLAANPEDGVTPPKTEQPRLRVPSAEEVARLIAATRREYRAAVAVAAATGLRRGEVLAMRWDAVKLDDGGSSLRVEGTLQRTPDGLVVLPPKTERSRRTVPIPPSLVTMLKSLRGDQLERRVKAGPAWRDGGYVFDRGDGRPVDPDTFGDAFRAARDVAKLEGVRLHDLRHAWASLQIEAGTDARTVSDLLGHATVGFTMQTYVHPNGDQRAAAAATVERLLGAALS